MMRDRDCALAAVGELQALTFINYACV